MKVTGLWLNNPATQQVMSMLAGGGFQAFAVGGCVRNALLKIAINDVDIATNAHPEQVIALAKNIGLKTVPTGIEHGTITVVCDNTGFEVTTFRKDIETDGRRAVVAFTETLDEDAHRRDFTVNALYADQDGTVTDPLGGLVDIAARKIRFIDNASDRIREDYLRILRFFRFHAWYGDADAGIDAEGLAACAELAEGIETLSKERIGHEILKLLASENPAPSLATMEISGILARVMPGATALTVAPLVHFEQELAVTPDPIRRLAAIGGEDPARNLRLSKVEQRRLATLSDGIASAAQMPELAYRLGVTAALDAALLRAAILQMPVPEGLFQMLQSASEQKFPIAAGDLAGNFQGASLGARLKKLEADWIASGFSLTKRQLLS